jgi:surface antigen
MMNDILTITAATIIFFAAIGLRGVFGYLKKSRVADVKFDVKTLLGGSMDPVAKIVSVGVLAVLLLVFLKLVASSGVQIAGIDQISPHTLLVGILIADVGAIGSVIQQALAAIFGLKDAQIQQIQEEAAKAATSDDSTLGAVITYKDGEIVASAETVTKVPVAEQLARDGVEIDDGVDVTAGKGSANTYPSYYANAAPDSVVDPSTCYNRECVSYVAWKIAELTGHWLRRTGDMNAKNWIYRLPENGYRAVPEPIGDGKYVGVLPQGTYGHVVWYESGNTISEYNYLYNHEYSCRQINLSQYQWFEIKSPSVVPLPEPAPEPQPKPTPTVPNNPASDEIKAGDSVIAWGRGTANSAGGGATTGDYMETVMKVIGINNNHYALNQYNHGEVGDPRAVTGWWASGQVRRV